METKFKTRENAKPSKPEVNNLPSQTIPDASISMRQILDRFQRGIPVTRTLRTPQYNENFNYLIIWNLMIFILLNWNNLKS